MFVTTSFTTQGFLRRYIISCLMCSFFVCVYFVFIIVFFIVNVVLFLSLLSLYSAMSSIYRLLPQKPLPWRNDNMILQLTHTYWPVHSALWNNIFKGIADFNVLSIKFKVHVLPMSNDIWVCSTRISLLA